MNHLTLLHYKQVINDVNTSTTDITELSYDSLIVSNVDIPLTNTNASPTITDGIVIGGNITDGQYNFNVQTDNIGLWPDASTHIEGGTSTIVNTIDNSDETTTRYNHGNEDFNFIFDLGKLKQYPNLELHLPNKIVNMNYLKIFLFMVKLNHLVQVKMMEFY